MDPLPWLEQPYRPLPRRMQLPELGPSDARISESQRHSQRPLPWLDRPYWPLPSDPGRPNGCAGLDCYQSPTVNLALNLVARLTTGRRRTGISRLNWWCPDTSVDHVVIIRTVADEGWASFDGGGGTYIFWWNGAAVDEQEPSSFGGGGGTYWTRPQLLPGCLLSRGSAIAKSRCGDRPFPAVNVRWPLHVLFQGYPAEITLTMHCEVPTERLPGTRLILAAILFQKRTRERHCPNITCDI